MKHITHSEELTKEDMLDIRMQVERGEIVSFSLNYRIKEGQRWRVIYRIDNEHGYLHEHRCWLSEEPFPIRGHMGMSIQEYIDQKKAEIKKDYWKYRLLWMMRR